MKDMDRFAALLDNLIDMVMEQQAKLGYMKEKIRLYYPLGSLRHMLGLEEEPDCEIMQDILEKFSESCREKVGEIRVSHEGERFCFFLSEDFSSYVHEHTPEHAFIHELIAVVGRHGASMQEVFDLFKAQEEECEIEQVGHGEFDYVIRFKEGKDRYVYCFKDEGFHIIYHRFMPEDYEEFAF